MTGFFHHLLSQTLPLGAGGSTGDDLAVALVVVPVVGALVGIPIVMAYRVSRGRESRFDDERDWWRRRGIYWVGTVLLWASILALVRSR